MNGKTQREIVKLVLGRVLNLTYEIQDQDLVIQLMGVCAHLFAYPDKATAEESKILRDAYSQLSEKGSL